MKREFYGIFKDDEQNQFFVYEHSIGKLVTTVSTGNTKTIDKTKVYKSACGFELSPGKDGTMVKLDGTVLRREV